jgi:hypothetical protein
MRGLDPRIHDERQHRRALHTTTGLTPSPKYNSLGNNCTPSRKILSIVGFDKVSVAAAQAIPTAIFNLQSSRRAERFSDRHALAV